MALDRDLAADFFLFFMRGDLPADLFFLLRHDLAADEKTCFVRLRPFFPWKNCPDSPNKQTRPTFFYPCLRNAFRAVRFALAPPKKQWNEAHRPVRTLAKPLLSLSGRTLATALSLPKTSTRRHRRSRPSSPRLRRSPGFSGTRSSPSIS